MAIDAQRSSEVTHKVLNFQTKKDEKDDVIPHDQVTCCTFEDTDCIIQRMNSYV